MFGSLSRFFGECRYDGIDSDRYAAHDGAMAPFAARAPVDNKEMGIVARLLLGSGGKKRRIGREKTHTEEGPARLEVSLVFIVRARKICMFGSPTDQWRRNVPITSRKGCGHG